MVPQRRTGCLCLARHTSKPHTTGKKFALPSPECCHSSALGDATRPMSQGARNSKQRSPLPTRTCNPHVLGKGCRTILFAKSRERDGILITYRTQEKKLGPRLRATHKTATQKRKPNIWGQESGSHHSPWRTKREPQVPPSWPARSISAAPSMVRVQN